MMENNGYKKRKTRYRIVLLIMFLIMTTLALTMLMLGNTYYNFGEVLDVLCGYDVEGATFAIMKIRLPRMLVGMLVGIAFGVSGGVFQTILRNPLASPDIIGISTGCSVGAVYCILIAGLSGVIVSIVSLITGLSVATAIYFLSKGSTFSGGRLILIGIGVQAFLNAIISYMLLKANQYEVTGAIRWLNGSLNGMSMKYVPYLSVIVISFVLIICIFSRHLQILELGDEFSISLGIKVNIVRIFLILSSVVLIAFATSVSGPISFVAFLSAPIATRLIGGGANKVLASGLVGGILVLLADIVGQFLFSTRFPVGVITGIIGAPYMLYLLVSVNKKGY